MHFKFIATEEVARWNPQFFAEYPGFLKFFAIISRTLQNLEGLKVSNGITRNMYKILSKLAMKTPEQRHWRHSGLSS